MSALGGSTASAKRWHTVLEPVGSVQNADEPNEGTRTFRREIRVMKKLLILTAVMMLSASATGCHFCERFCRGTYTAPMAAPVYAAPCYDPCNPCSAPVGMAPAAVAAPAPM